MNKKIFALLMTVVMLFSLTGCNNNEPAITNPTTEPAVTEPAQPEASRIISQVQWVVNDPFDMKDQWDCQYDAMSNTLVITGEVYDTREIVFFEGCKQVQKETCLDREGMILSQKEYDEQGNLIYEMDDYGYRKVYTYENGVLVKETDYFEDPEPVAETVWCYDDAGRKASCTEYEDGQLVQQESWSYDDAGFCNAHRLESYYDDDFWFDYETFVYKDGLLVESTHDGDDPANAWDYSVSYRYDDQGRMVSALNKDEFYGNAEDTWEYDSEGRIIKSVEHSNMDGWFAVTNEFEYDAEGHLTRNAVQEVYLGDNEIYYSDEFLYTYDSNGQLTQTKCNSLNGVQYTTSQSYDGHGNRTLYSHVVDGEEQYLLICDYDSKGNRIRVDRNGETELTSDEILFLTNENDVEFYMAVQYEDATDAAEAAAVNDFILQYIQNNY